jgi:SSS family solute:Na+ symporter
MNGIDVIIVFAYLAALFIWAITLGIRESAEDFLIFSRKAPLLLVTFSMTSTWVGIGTTVATAASGYDTGVSLAITAGAGGVIGALVAGWFAPRLKWFGDSYLAHTVGDLYVVRYSRGARALAAGFILIVYTLLAAAQFVGLGTLLGVWTGLQYDVIVWFTAISTIIYTAFAGIKSDFYTDAVHFVVMVVVFFVALLPLTIGDPDLGPGMRALPASFFDPFAYGGVSFFVAGLIFGAGSMFLTMEVWQRVYASASPKTARLSLYLSVIMIVGFYLASGYFGLAARALIPDIPHRDQALFVLMQRYLPTGLLGLGIAGFTAVFISTVNSLLMVSSATVTKDFYLGIFNRVATEKQILRMGRLSTLVCGLVALGVAILFRNLVALAVNALFMLLILMPSMVGGFFWRRGTASGAIASILAGMIVLFSLLPFWPESAFVPAFGASLVTYLGVSLKSKHQGSEDLQVVRGWVDNGRAPNNKEGSVQ